MEEDQAIAEIREVRRRISEECEHDPRTLVSYYKGLQLQRKERLLLSEELEIEVAAELNDSRGSS